MRGMIGGPGNRNNKSGSLIGVESTTLLLVAVFLALIALAASIVRRIRQNANDENLFDDDDDDDDDNDDEPRVSSKRGAYLKIVFFLIPWSALIFWVLAAESCSSDLLGVRGIEINRPVSVNSAPIDDKTFIRITQKGEYMFRGLIVSEADLRMLFVSKKDIPLVIVSHQASPTDSMIYLMDLARESGVNDISLAADK